MKKNCVACGMPMAKPADFAAGDELKDYCKFCARPDGSMQSYSQKLDSMSNFMAKDRGLSKDDARSAARELMADLPAWKDK